MPDSRPPFPDYYSDLRIAPDASQEEVRSAWRSAAKVWHPDTNGSDEAPAMMRRVNEAWNVLGDRDNRREYDDLYFVWRSGSEQLAAGLRERLSAQQQSRKARQEAEEWRRWSQSDRTRWGREAGGNGRQGQSGQGNGDGVGARRRGDVQDGRDERRSERESEVAKRFWGTVSLGVILIVFFLTAVAIAANS